MFSSLFLTTVLAAVLVKADPTPSEPSPGSVFKEGDQCRIAWEPDTTGTWKTMNIELMSGSNLQMNHITTVATLDGTDATKAVFTYPCPEVTPNSAIYFYQFTSPDSSSISWTTRFTIAAADGSTTPPENAQQTNGDAIPWGVGALTDPSKATPAPARGQSSVAAGNSTASGSTVIVSVTSGPSSSAPVVSVTATSGTSSQSSSSARSLAQTSPSATANATGGSTQTNANDANGAMGHGALDSRLMQAVASLGVVAFAFAAYL